MSRVGIFDSGVGGLTVLREVQRRLPGIATVYLGDTARVPYGIRSADVVRRYALENTRFLVDQRIDALVIACNTATAVALETIRAAVAPLPVLGVVEPGARRAAAVSPSGHIAVVATEATIESGAYEDAIRAASPDATVIGRACPLFVPLAEEGWISDDIAVATARRYLQDLPGQGVDTVVLGCTHYPLLRGTIAGVLGDAIEIVDSASSTAEALESMLGAPGAGSAAHEFYVTDAPARFARVGERFLGQPLPDVQHVDVVK